MIKINNKYKRLLLKNNKDVKPDKKTERVKINKLSAKNLKGIKYNSIVYSIKDAISYKNGTIRFKHVGKIDILIPLYNKLKYIKRCLEGIENQTRKDLIGTVYILSQTKCEYEYVEHIKKDFSFDITNIEHERMDPSSARNFLVKQAKNDWISFIDADDYYEKDFFEMFTDYNQDSAFMSPLMISDNLSKESRERIYREFNRWEYINIVFNNLTCIAHKSLFEEHKLKKKFAFGGEDMDFLLNLFLSHKYYITLHKRAFIYTHDDVRQLSKQREFEKTHMKMIFSNLKKLKSNMVDFDLYNNFIKFFVFFNFEKTKKIFKIIFKDINKILKQSFKKEIDVEFDEQLKVASKKNSIKAKEYIDVKAKDMFSKTINEFLYLLTHYNCSIPKRVNEEYLMYMIRASGIKYLPHGEKIKKLISKLTEDYEKKKRTKFVEITFELPIPCNMHCKYCFQKERTIKNYSEKEILDSLKKRLKQCEKVAKKDGLRIYPKLMGGEISVLRDEFVEEIFAIFNNYNNILIFSNGSNRDGVVYNTNKRLMTHLFENNIKIMDHKKRNESFTLIYDNSNKERIKNIASDQNVIANFDRYKLSDDRTRKNIYKIPMKAIDIMTGEVVPCWKLGIAKTKIEDVKSFKKMKVGCNKPCDNCIYYFGVEDGVCNS